MGYHGDTFMESLKSVPKTVSKNRDFYFLPYLIITVLSKSSDISPHCKSPLC